LDNSRFLYSRRTNNQFQEAFGIDSNDDIVFNRNSIVAGVDGDAPKASSALIFGTGAERFVDVRNSSNATLLRVQESSGFVGIGTNNPGAKLHVSGGDVLFENKWRTETTTVNPGPVTGPPNLIAGFLGTLSSAGWTGNRVTAGVVGATIGGGGFVGPIN